MFKTIALLILIVGAGFLSSQFFPEIGEVSIVFAHNKLSLPLTVLLSLLLVIYIIIFVILRTILSAYFSTKKFMQMLIGTDHNLAMLIYDKAMFEQMSGNYRAAQKMFIKATGGLKQPLVAYLQAAKCAQTLKNYTERDKLMLLCFQRFTEHASLINFQYALMCEASGDHEKSLSLLLNVDSEQINYEEFLRLKAQLWFNTANFAHLLDLLPAINKIHVFNEHDLLKIQLATYNHALHNTASGEQLAQQWSQIPKNLRSMPGLIITYTKLLASSDLAQAETILRKAIEHDYHPLMVEAYGCLETTNLAKKISYAEAWYKEHALDYALNITLVRLYIQQKIWGKAKELLDKSLALKADAESFMEYARLCALMGDKILKIEHIEHVLAAK